MKDYYIIPTTKSFYETIDAESKEEALQVFVDNMDSDMHAYFQADENEPESHLHGYENPTGDYETAMTMLVDTFHGNKDSDNYDESVLQYLTLENTQAIVDLQASYDSMKQLGRGDMDEMDVCFFSILHEISGFIFDVDDEEMGDYMLSARLLVDDADLNAAIDILDDNFIDNDIDSGNRIMISPDDVEEAIELLEKNSIDVDEV